MSLGADPSLDASVLALNKFYVAVHVISVRGPSASSSRTWPR